jgi:hypothetical protein
VAVAVAVVVTEPNEEELTALDTATEPRALLPRDDDEPRLRRPEARRCESIQHVAMRERERERESVCVCVCVGIR